MPGMSLRAAWRAMAGTAAVAIGDAKNSERQVHQPECVVEPRHRASALACRQHGVHEHVDLRRCEPERSRPHQNEDLAQSRLAQIEQRPVAVPFLVQQRPLRDDLPGAADEHADRHRGDRREAHSWHQWHEQDRAQDARDVEHRGRQRGHEEPVQRVQHPHERGGYRHERQERQHDPGEEDSQLQLAWYLAVIVREHGHERLCEQQACAHHERRHDEERVDDVVAQAPRGGAPFASEIPRERRDERRAHRAFREEVSHQVRNPERDVVGVDRVAGAEQVRHDLIAHEAEHAARHRGDANNARRSGESSSLGLRDLRAGDAAGLRIRAGRRCAHGLATGYYSEQRRPGEVRQTRRGCPA